MGTSHYGARLALAGLLITSGIGFAACGSDDEAPSASAPIPDSRPAVSSASVVTDRATAMSAPPPSSSIDTTVQSPAPVEIVGVYEAVEAYPACGNEPLHHGGVTWYPLGRNGYEPIDSALQARVNEILAVERQEPADARFQGFGRVPYPGPGDDIGTLVVWADGVARWVSDSGTIDVWMIDDEITYMWVC